VEGREKSNEKLNRGRRVLNQKNARNHYVLRKAPCEENWRGERGTFMINLIVLKKNKRKRLGRHSLNHVWERIAHWEKDKDRSVLAFQAMESSRGKRMSGGKKRIGGVPRSGNSCRWESPKARKKV